jgi:hypothetical protein
MMENLIEEHFISHSATGLLSRTADVIMSLYLGMKNRTLTYVCKLQATCLASVGLEPHKIDLLTV